MTDQPRSTKIAPARPQVADQVRRIEEAFLEPPQRSGPSPEAVRAAEALLFASGEALTAAELQKKLGEGVDIAAALMRLKKEYQGRGIELVEVGGAWRFQSAPDLSTLFAEKRQEPRKLPRAALETLAVIAYHQPVTRAEIEDVRGVSLAKGSLDLLLEIGWVRPRGRRRSPGRPLTFGTTDAFLAHFGLAGLDSLPGKEDLKALGLMDARAAGEIDVPRPSDDQGPDEEPLSAGDDAEGFFVDHLREGED